MRTDLAYFILDGKPLCDCQCNAYHDRLRAAGSPRCEGPVAEQLEKFAALAAQFPGRIALGHGACPTLLGVLRQ
ncbi:MULTISPECIES: hypothetical protein [unclassified Rhodanobacter]|uniref:hypothetical protein n=1 Tax=unclassified Rhodanobacter TaxID=2621553 RepID=UPI0007AA3466|nr:hypothetical protein [Rhodanobacter sp. FW510-R10]KZC32626.1 hypothetical protein RhoFW510R10_11980 [Rhodanobacter sp. FW510-R10]